MLGVNARRARAYAGAWRRWVSAGEALCTGSPKGERVLATHRGADPWMARPHFGSAGNEWTNNHDDNMDAGRAGTDRRGAAATNRLHTVGREPAPVHHRLGSTGR